MIKHEEQREAAGLPGQPADRDRGESAPLSPVEDAQAEVARTFLITGAITLAAALLAGYLLAARTAAPLRRMAATATAVDAGELTPRIGSEGSAAVEVRTLAEAFDHMLDRLDDAFSRQRQFVSDASHELRTPLTAIRGQLEVLARSDRIEPEEVRRVEGVVLSEMGRIERLVEDLLTLARLDEAAPLQRREIALAPYLRRLAEERVAGRRCGRRAGGRHPARRSRPADPGDPQPARQRPPPRRPPRAGRDLRPEARGSRLTIRVDDDGAGDRPGRTRAGLRPLSPQRGGAGPRLGRQRAGAGDRPLDRRAARRADLGGGLAPGRGPGRLRAGRIRTLSSARRRSARRLRAPSSAPEHWAADRRSLLRFRRCTRRRGRDRRWCPLRSRPCSPRGCRLR